MSLAARRGSAGSSSSSIEGDMKNNNHSEPPSCSPFRARSLRLEERRSLVQSCCTKSMNTTKQNQIQHQPRHQESPCTCSRHLLGSVKLHFLLTVGGGFGFSSSLTAQAVSSNETIAQVHPHPLGHSISSSPPPPQPSTNPFKHERCVVCKHSEHSCCTPWILQ